MSLAVLSESKLIEVLVSSDRLAETLVIVAFKVDLVQTFIDVLVIRILH